MKSIILSFSLLMFLIVAKAQTTSFVAGTKFKVVQESKLTNTSSMMGTDMTADINSTVYSTIEIKSVTDSGIILASTTTRIKGYMNAMGQENSYDSDDSNSMNNPLVAAQLKGLNKTETFLVNNGKAKALEKSTSKENQSIPSLMNAGNEFLIGELFVPAEIRNKSEGYKWATDDTNEDGTQTETTIFTLKKVTEAETEITSNSNSTTKGTTKMMGMDVKQNLSGTRNSNLTFKKNTGLLSFSTQNIIMSGTEELMGNSIPISLKGTVITKVL